MRKLFFALFPLCFVACNSQQAKQEATPVPVKIQVIADWNAQTEHHYVGVIESERSLSLTFTLGGTLVETHVKNGQMVKKGQLIARVDNTSAEAMHQTALATLRQAEDGYERLKKVREGGGISDVRWMQMVTDLEKARQAEITARKHLEDCFLYAPQDGLIAGADAPIGTEFRPMEVYACLMDINRLRVAYSVPEQEISNIQIGSIAHAFFPAISEDCEVKISDRSYLTNPLGHTYNVRATIPTGVSKDRLLPGMVAKVSMNTASHEGIVVPSSCIQTMAEGLAVWTIHNGKAERRYVTATDYVQNGVLLGEGLHSGDTIVTTGYQKLYSGACVSVIQ